MYRRTFAILTIVLPLALLACSEDAEDSQPRPDENVEESDPESPSMPANEAPTVLSVTPADGATGVRIDEPVEIHFSEPMDPTTVAISSAETFHVSWNESWDVATIHVELDYAEGYGVTPELWDRRAYAFTLEPSAADAEGEVVGEPLTWSFSTALHLTAELYPDTPLTRTVMGDGTIHSEGGDLYVGDSDVLVDVSMRGVVTFDVSSIPADGAVETATLSAEQISVAGTPYVSLGSILVEHVAFDAIDLDTWDAPVFGETSILSGSPDLELKSADVTQMVSESLDRGDDLGDRTQLMLRFAEPNSINGHGDTARFDIDTVAMEVAYLVP